MSDTDTNTERVICQQCGDDESHDSGDGRRVCRSCSSEVVAGEVVDSLREYWVTLDGLS